MIGYECLHSSRYSHLKKKKKERKKKKVGSSLQYETSYEKLIMLIHRPICASFGCVDHFFFFFYNSQKSFNTLGTKPVNSAIYLLQLRTQSALALTVLHQSSPNLTHRQPSPRAGNQAMLKVFGPSVHPSVGPSSTPIQPSTKKNHHISCPYFNHKFLQVRPTGSQKLIVLCPSVCPSVHPKNFGFLCLVVPFQSSQFSINLLQIWHTGSPTIDLETATQ